MRHRAPQLRNSLLTGDSWSELFCQLARIGVMSTYFLEGRQAAQTELETYQADYARRHSGAPLTIDVLQAFIVISVILAAIFAPWIAPTPESAGAFVDFRNRHSPPNWQNLMGTDTVGRDVFSRVIFGYRVSLGLGVQPPTPDLGTMVATGSEYLPEMWWQAVMPGLAILYAILGFNLLGDGLRDMLDVEL